MENFILNIVSNLTSALIGLLFGAFLGSTLRKKWRQFNYWWKQKISPRIHRPDLVSLSEDEFHFGKWRTGWVVIVGSSSDPITPDHVDCFFDPRPIILPPERQVKRKQIEAIHAKLRKEGKPAFHDGPTVAVVEAGESQWGINEEPGLILHLRRSGYFDYLATARSLDDLVRSDDGNMISVRDMYLRGLNYKSPIPEFAAAISLNLSLITSDGFIIVSKRATAGIVSNQGRLMPPLCETVNPELDRDASGNISLFKTAERGARNELHIEITEDELLFFTFGVETKYYYHDLTGLIISKRFTWAEIKSRLSIGAKESWESENYYVLPPKGRARSADSIAQWMSEISAQEQWGSTGLVCLIQTMIHEFKLRPTQLALIKYPPKDHDSSAHG